MRHAGAMPCLHSYADRNRDSHPECRSDSDDQPRPRHAHGYSDSDAHRDCHSWAIHVDAHTGALVRNRTVLHGNGNGDRNGVTMWHMHTDCHTNINTRAGPRCPIDAHQRGAEEPPPPARRSRR